MSYDYDSSLELFEFAANALQRLGSICLTIATEKPPSIDLGNLGSQLYIIGLELGSLSTVDPRRVQKLLGQLERACTWKTGGATASSQKRRQPFDQSRFPSLSGVVSGNYSHEVIRGNLRALISEHPKVRNSLLSNLESVNSIGKLQADLEDIRRALGPEEKSTDGSIELAVEVLHEALRPYFTCNCKIEHHGRLRLKRKLVISQIQIQDDVARYVQFDMFLWGLNEDQQIPWWQKLQIEAPEAGRKLKRTRAVRFHDEEIQKVAQHPNKKTPECLSRDQFCQLLGIDQGAVRFKLLITDKEHESGQVNECEKCLLQRNGIDQLDQYVEDSNSITLAELLRLNGLSSTQKIILAYILARSVWQYYTSDWISQKWTSEAIHFMKEPLRGENTRRGVLVDGHNPCNPCFAFELKDHPNPIPEYLDMDLIHRYPRILSLAVLLVEIGGKQHPVEASKNTSVFSFQKQMNNDWGWAHDSLSESQWPQFSDLTGSALKLVREVYAEVVEKCLTDFKDHVQNPAISDEKLPERRDRLYNNVVIRLGRLIKHFGWDSETPLDITTEQAGEQYAFPSKSLQMNPNLQPQTHNGIPQEMTVSSLKIAQVRGFTLFPNEEDTDGKKNFLNAQRFWKRLQWVRDTQIYNNINKSPKGRTDRVRIAIIDTGIDVESSEIYARWENIKCIRTFTSQPARDLYNSGPGTEFPEFSEDKHEHGTATTALLLKVAPKADVYVAQISKDGSIYDTKIVADAIRWATEQWNVDIITMSFGIEKTCSFMEEEIRKSFAKGKIMLAAGSNDGGNRGRFFPANDPVVICIHATDGYGNEAGFSPSNLANEDNFATLGVGIKSYWNDEFRYRGGTSYATPIAAGIAALLLDYVRLNMDLTVQQEKSLYSYTRMRKMFYLMSDLRRGYNYVAPWNLFDRENAESLIRELL